ncbi:MAG: ABC transporter substrate-binding protein [Fusobacteriaceae bacterium]
MKGKLLFIILTFVFISCGEKKEENKEKVTEIVAEFNKELMGPAHLDISIKNPALARTGSEETLIVGQSEAQGNFLPMYYSTAYDAPVVSLVFEGLLSINKNGENIPLLAEELPKISEDGKSYTFKIKKGIKFHSGNELTAQDIVFTYGIIADPTYDSRFTSTVEDFIGYDEYSAGKSEIFKGIEKIDDNTVTFHFKEKLIENITKFGMGILDSKYYAYTKGDLSPVKSKLQDLSGTGPYMLNKFVPRQYVEMVKNENYWEEKPTINKIILKFVSSATEIQELIKGSIDLLPAALEPENLELANKTGYVDRAQYLRHGYGYLKFNNQDEVLKDKKVRKALSYGLDRATFLDLYFKGLAITIDAPVSKVWWTYDKSLEDKMTVYDYNPQKAKELLDEAGWIMASDGYRYKDGKKMTIIWNSIKDLSLVDVLMPILFENWKSLGVDIKITLTDFNTLIDKVYKERTGFSMFNMATSEGFFPSPYSSWHSKFDIVGGNNTTQFRNEKNDKLIEAMRKELDREKYKELWQEWALNMNDEAPMITLYTNTYTDLFNRRVKNFNPDSLWDWTSDIKNIRLENE